MKGGVKLARPRVVDAEPELRELVTLSTESGRVAFDTEFLRERTYRPKLCLAQIATTDDLWLVDPTNGLDLATIAGLIADPQVEVVVHAGRQDFELLHDRYGVVPANVFDVQLAAGFAGYGSSLPYGKLVESVAGVSLSKGESYTDWCRRPLTEAQLHYAADDVRYLLQVADALKERLAELGRVEWVAEEMKAFESESAYVVDLDQVWRKVAGRGTLSGPQTAVLKELARWREQSAADRDLPRGWVIKDPTLVEIARRRPTSLGALKSIRGISEREVDRSGRAMLAAVERGRNAPSIGAQPAPPKAALARARMLVGPADAVVRARCEQARVATELVATRGELEAILAAAFSGTLEEPRYRLLTGWRRKLAGEAVLDLAHGRIAVRAIDKPPYIEEVRV